MPWYIADMQYLQTSHPETWHEIVRNIFVRKSEIPFVSIAADHACEQVNRMMKIHSGLIGISNNANARQRFFLATGFIYLIFAISRLTWEAHHIRVEELLTLIIPAAFATFRIFEDQRQKRKPEEVYNYSGGLLTTYFLALGIVWFFSLLSVYIFKITIGTTEFYWTLFLPLFYAISTRFRKNRKTQADSE